MSNVSLNMFSTKIAKTEGYSTNIPLSRVESEAIRVLSEYGYM